MLLAAGLGAAPAMADSVMVRPARDVVVVYRSIGMSDGVPPAVTMHFANNGNTVRIDDASGDGYVVFDNVSGSMRIVSAEKKMFRERASDPAKMPVFLSLTPTLRPAGTANIAGMSCTAYDAEIGGKKGQLCLTADGVLLRAQSIEQGKTQILEATSVTFAPQDPSLFKAPAGFKNADGEVKDPNARHPFVDYGNQFPPRGSYWGQQSGR